MKIRAMLVLSAMAAVSVYMMMNSADVPGRPADFRDAPHENPVRRIGEDNGLLRPKPGQRYYIIDYKEGETGDGAEERKTSAAADLTAYQDCLKALGGKDLKEFGVDQAQYTDGTRKLLDKDGEPLSGEKAIRLVSDGLNERIGALYKDYKAGKTSGERNYSRMAEACGKLRLDDGAKQRLMEMKKDIRDI